MGRFDVSSLGALVAAAKEDDEFSSDLTEVDAESRTKGDLEFQHTFAYWFAFPKVAQTHPVYSRLDLGLGAFVPKAVKPGTEWLGAA